MQNFIGLVHAQVIEQLDVATPLQEIFQRTINWALYIGGAVAVIYIIYGGFTYITAAGDEAKAEQGRNTLTYAIIGIILIGLSFAIVNWLNNWLQGNII